MLHFVPLRSSDIAFSSQAALMSVACTGPQLPHARVSHSSLKGSPLRTIYDKQERRMNICLYTLVFQTICSLYTLSIQLIHYQRTQYPQVGKSKHTHTRKRVPPQGSYSKWRTFAGGSSSSLDRVRSIQFSIWVVRALRNFRVDVYGGRSL